MDHEIQLISDGDGLAVIGNAADVERFLASEGLPPSKDLGLPRLKSVLSSGAALAQAGSEMSSNSGRWVQLTRESTQLAKKYGLRESSGDVLTGVIKGDKGQIRGFVEFAKGPGSHLANPALLAGAAGIMAQLAMQQAMDDITDYLAAIDEKVDDVLRAQKDAALSRMIGVDFVIREAMTIRDSRGRVDEITWSKVHSTPATIAETQAYALRQLDALAEKLESKSAVSDLAATTKKAETAVQEWLAVLARCFQLQDAIAVLELDRVLDASPDELDGHRRGLKAARQDRLQIIGRCTERLLARMDAAVSTANANVLLNPLKSPAVVQSGNHVAAVVHGFQERLGLESGRQSSEARRWTEAATEKKDRALEVGAQGVSAVADFGTETFERASSVTSSVTGKLSSGVTQGARWWRGNEKDGKDET